MNNNAFKNFMNQDFKSLSDWISTLNPYEFTFVATFIGAAIASILNNAQQNSMGNFFEQLGQTLETISAQGQTNNQWLNQQQNNPNKNYDKDIDDLKIQIEQLKRKVNNNS